ncbi:MAG: hypothetical protein SGI83_10365 [Bacteroidota bacterium]|nr:hypothetical protein [Bacteroidota bacterium]
MLYIDVPTKEQWELHTKTALSVRDEILKFVASKVQAEQAPDCRYEIKSNSIIFYYQ